MRLRIQKTMSEFIFRHVACGRTLSTSLDLDFHLAVALAFLMLSPTVALWEKTKGCFA